MIDKVWLAGWFEARGHIIIECREVENKRSGGLMRRDRFGLGVCAPEPLIDHLLATYGGKVYATKHTLRDWRVNAAKAAAFLLDLRPHITLRRDEVDHALQFYSTLRAGRRGVSVGGTILKMRTESANAFWQSRSRRPGYAYNRRRAKLLRNACGD
jgi:hypothetical protein